MKLTPLAEFVLLHFTPAFPLGAIHLHCKVGSLQPKSSERCVECDSAADTVHHERMGELASGVGVSLNGGFLRFRGLERTLSRFFRNEEGSTR